MRLAPICGALAPAMLTVLLLAGCTGADTGTGLIAGGTETAGPIAPGGPGVEVDTAELRALKATAGIEDCAPGAASSDLPAVTVACLGGGPAVDLSTLKGPLVLNFWQSACAPCRFEMPVLGDFHRQYGDQVPILGIDLLDTAPGKALELAGERDATYPQLADPDGELLTQPAFVRAARGLPFTAFVDADGTVVTQATGGIKSVAELVDRVDKAFGLDLAGSGSRS